MRASEPTSIEPERGRPLGDDGRHRRSARTKQAVLGSLLAFLRAGHARPTARQIAERAGVSTRAVFRHYDQLETLLLELEWRERRRVIAVAAPLLDRGTLADRINALVARRARTNEDISPIQRALVRAENGSLEVARRLRLRRQEGQKEIAFALALELGRLCTRRRQDLVRRLSAVTSCTYWEELRQHQGFTVARSRQIVAAEALFHVEHLLTTALESDPERAETSGTAPREVTG